MQTANLTLARNDAYLENLKPGVEHDMFSALRNCPLNGYALFSDAIIRKAEDEITQYENGYILPFKTRPPLVRDPLIISGYANPRRNLNLQEALHTLIRQKAVERVRVRTSLAFFNRLFIVPKPNQKWWPILDLSALN